MKASVFVGTSVDGFIARHNGDFDFLPEGGGEPHGYAEFIATVDVLVIGRNTFDKVLTFDTWPYQDMRVVVLSNRAVDTSLNMPISTAESRCNIFFERVLYNGLSSREFLSSWAKAFPCSDHFQMT